MSPIVENGSSKKDYRPINVSKISPSELGQFLTFKGLKFWEKPSYIEIFSTLRRFFKKEQQEDLLICFYTEGVKDFPNAKNFAKELIRINNVDYFKPKEEPDSTVLQELANQHLFSLDLQEAPIKIIRDDWFLAEDVELDVICDEKLDARCIAVQSVVVEEVVGNAVWNAGRDKVQQDAIRYTSQHTTKWNTVLSIVWDIVLDKTRDTVRDVAGVTVWEAIGDVAWIIAEDKMPDRGYIKGNPFSPLISIYELGYWPIGLAENEDGKKEFVIFIPPIQKTAAK